MGAFEITERWLMSCGGWQEMSSARALWRAGAASLVEFDGTRLHGRVRAGARTFASGLHIKSLTDVENLCGCPESRKRSIICAHSLAVGLAWIHRDREVTPSAAAPPADGGVTPRKVAANPIAVSGALSFALPERFFDGLRRDRLTVSVRADPANPDRGADRPFLDWLAAEGVERVPPVVSLSRRVQIDALLESLTGHPRVFVGKSPLRIGAGELRLPLSIVRSAAGEVILRTPAIDRQTQYCPPGADGGRGWIFARDQAKLLPVRASDLVTGLVRITPDGSSGKPELTRSWEWLARHFDEVQEVFRIDEAESDPAVLALRRVPGDPRFELELDGSLSRIEARLWCRYPAVEARLPAGGPERSAFPVQDQKNDALFYDRNPIAEAAALDRLRRAGFVLENPNRLSLKGEDAVLQFFAGELERLRHEWDVQTGRRFAEATSAVERLKPEWKPVGSGETWFTFDVQFASERGTRVSHADVRRLFQSGRGHRRLANGRIGVVSLDTVRDLDEVLRDTDVRQEHGHYSTDNTQRAYLAETFGVADARPEPLVNEVDVRPEVSALEEHLRPYQNAGIEWMAALARVGRGGILADEMGLGKTLQSLVIIAALRRLAPSAPVLVVCPKSLTGNWLEEAARFIPDLRAVRIQGAQREVALGAMTEAEVVVTSYHLLVADFQHHRRIQWSGIILDEAGFIRNPATRTAQTVRRLSARCRFALTGTPIENSVRDLWSIMDFVQPGYLGDRDDFTERYERPPDSAESSGPVMRRLRRRMHPFWLRRTKADVLRDLPEKIVRTMRCELTDLQREVYARVLREGTERVRASRKPGTTGQSHFIVLTALLRLRQACCDPRLLDLELPAGLPPADRSGKIAVLVDLLAGLRDGGHNVLIFSQFASMLNLLKEVVTAAGLEFCHLDGSSRDRDAEVRRFRDDPAKRVFLISLKAGGFGLNLTKADAVIHFDPWWNPAVEAQATDRAHRIGQSRPVSVYKLVAAGTVEEKILRLQDRKRQVIDAALDDAQPLMQGLNQADLQELLSD